MKNPNIDLTSGPVKSRKSWLFLALFLFSAFSISADYIIHIQNPWRDSMDRADTLWMLGNNIVGYYPGTKMKNEGGGWFSYSYPSLDTTQANRFLLASYRPTTYDIGAGALKYPAGRFFSIDSLFSLFSPIPTGIWIYIDGPSEPAQVFDHPKNGTAIHVFNPWPDNSPQIIIGKRDAMRDRVSIFSLAGRCLRKAQAGSGISLSGIPPQPLLVQVSRNGKTMSTNNLRFP